jgi:hypothetical protein
MLANEFRKRGSFSAKYALAITIALEEGKTIESEFAEAKQALLQWHGRRGKRATTVMFAIVGGPQELSGAEQFLAEACRDDPELAPVLQSLSAEVALLDEDGNPVKEYKIGI